jgi:redox-sensing transcriptional repressor
VPKSNAQLVCDKLVDSGILAIWNFAPVNLKVPENILVRNENMAVSLAFLSKHLEETLMD